MVKCFTKRYYLTVFKHFTSIFSLIVLLSYWNLVSAFVGYFGMLQDVGDDDGYLGGDVRGILIGEGVLRDLGGV